MKTLFVFISLFQRGPSKPDEIFGGGSNIGDFFVLAICLIVLTFFAVVWIASKFSPQPENVITDEMKKANQRKWDTERIDNLIERGKNEEFFNVVIPKEGDHELLVNRILEVSKAPITGLSTIDQELFKSRLMELSYEDLRGVSWQVDQRRRN